MTQKIAFPTDDGTTISAHFGRAKAFYVVVLSESGESSSELRKSAASGGMVSLEEVEHHSHDHDHAHDHNHHGDHQHGHGAKFKMISDCDVVIGRGMGQPAYNKLVNAGLQVIMTGVKSIEEALVAYQAGTLDSDMRRVHAHNHH